MTAARVGAVAAAGALAYQLVVRPRYAAYGATEEEIAAAYPGDDLVPGGTRGGIMATDIAATPAEVWPWLVQMGCNRAGWYSWDRLDNGGRPSAGRIHPEWQQIAEGDRWDSVPDGSRWFEVALVEPERALVLRASMTLPAARPFDPEGGLPCAYVDSTWGFHLRPAGQGGTRLLTTGWVRARPRPLTEAIDWLVWDPAHWIMQTKQFRELGRRAQSASRSVVPRSRQVAQTG